MFKRQFLKSNGFGHLAGRVGTKKLTPIYTQCGQLSAEESPGRQDERVNDQAEEISFAFFHAAVLYCSIHACSSLSEIPALKRVEERKVPVPACQTVLMDQEAVRRVAQENRTLFERIRDFILDMAEQFRAAFAEIDTAGDFPLYKEVRAAQGAMDEMRQLWLNAFDVASENLQAERAEGQNETAAQEGDGAQFMSFKTAERDGFETLIDRYYQGKLWRNDPVYIGPATGTGAAMIESDAPLMIAKTGLDKSTRNNPDGRRNLSAHSMDERFIRTLPTRINDAVMSYTEDRNGVKSFTFVVFNEYTGKLTAIGGALNAKYEGRTVNQIRSIYDIGTPEAFLTKSGKNMVLADKKKAEDILRRARIQASGLQEI